MNSNPSRNLSKYPSNRRTIFLVALHIVVLSFHSLCLVTGCVSQNENVKTNPSESIGVSRSVIQSYFAEEPWGFQFVNKPVIDDQGRLHFAGAFEGIDGKIAAALELIVSPNNQDEVIAVATLIHGVPDTSMATVNDFLICSLPAAALGQLVTPDWKSFESEFLTAFGQVFTSIIPETNRATIMHGNLKYEFAKQDKAQTLVLSIRHK